MSALAEEPWSNGSNGPRLCVVPDGAVSSLGPHAIKWAKTKLGVDLFPWQQEFLTHLLAQRADEKWAASQAVLILPRQNGKTLVLLVYLLYGVLVLKDAKAIYSAHDGSTARASYGEMVDLLERTKPGTAPRREISSGGREHITFDGLGVIEFKTRTKSGGRGFSADKIVLDEAQELQDTEIQALNPTMAARSVEGNPQVVYAGSPGDFDSAVFARMRRAGLANAPRLLLVEHSIDDEVFLDLDPDGRLDMLMDPVQRARGNPLYGVRISDEFLTDQLAALGAIGFAKEHMGVGSWPVDDSADWIIPRAKWAACADPTSSPPVGTVAFAIGAAWDRTVSVAVCGHRDDGLTYAELVADPTRKSAEALVKWVLRLRDEHNPCAIVIDPGGPAGPFVAPLEAAGVELVQVSVRDVAHACGALVDAVVDVESEFRHRDQSYVKAALSGARRKDIGDGWVLDRRRSSSDVTPLEVIALARWGFVAHGNESIGLWGFFE